MSNTEQQPLKATAQEPVNMTTIMIVAVLFLSVFGLAYSQGWLGSWFSSTEVEGVKVSASQTIDQAQTEENAVNVAKETAEPAQSATK